MNEDFTKWLLKKAGLGMCECEIEEVSLLMKTMWAINRDKKSRAIIMNEYTIDYYYMKNRTEMIKEFQYISYNNLEKKALEAALFYIYEQEKK